MAANPIEFSVGPSGFSSGDSGETYAMDTLSWNYYPVNVAKFNATHQVQITDSRGNLICSDTVPCGVFNADDVYTFTYKFPADWGRGNALRQVFHCGSELAHELGCRSAEFRGLGGGCSIR